MSGTSICGTVADYIDAIRSGFGPSRHSEEHMNIIVTISEAHGI